MFLATIDGCLQCGKCSHIVNRSHEISEIPVTFDENIFVTSIKKVTEEYLHTGKVEYRCEKCNYFHKEMQVKKQLLKAPEVLVLVLSRFKMISPTIYTKLNNMVAFPERLDIKVGIAQDEGRVNYRLQAVIRHIGQNVETGHYVCEARRGDKCYVFDDSQVCT